eukprot:9436841-Pyramimonas_sp.AAC.1
MNHFQLPFTLADSQEKAVVQQVVTGLMGASIPMLMGRVQGRPNMNLPSLTSLSKSARHRRQLPNDVPIVD